MNWTPIPRYKKHVWFLVLTCRHTQMWLLSEPPRKITVCDVCDSWSSIERRERIR